MNNQELERFEKDLYQQEKKEFLSDKCIHCMEYVNQETEKCDNGLCAQYYEEYVIIDDVNEDTGEIRSYNELKGNNFVIQTEVEPFQHIGSDINKVYFLVNNKYRKNFIKKFSK